MLINVYEFVFPISYEKGFKIEIDDGLETMREFSVLGCDPFAAFQDCLPNGFGRTHGYRDSASEKGKMSPIRYLLIAAALLVFANWAIHGYRSGLLDAENGHRLSRQICNLPLLDHIHARGTSEARGLRPGSRLCPHQTRNESNDAGGSRHGEVREVIRGDSRFQNSNNNPTDGNIGNMLKNFGDVCADRESYGPGESKSRFL